MATQQAVSVPVEAETGSMSGFVEIDRSILFHQGFDGGICGDGNTRAVNTPDRVVATRIRVHREAHDQLPAQLYWSITRLRSL